MRRCFSNKVRYSDKNLLQEELIFGITGYIGADLSGVEKYIIEYFGNIDIQCSVIRSSSILLNISDHAKRNKHGKSAHKRKLLLQSCRDLLRIETGLSEAMAVSFIYEINTLRKSNALSKVVIIKSFKHPFEVELMKSVYGSRFVLIGCSAPFNYRLASLKLLYAEASERFLRQLMENDRFGTCITSNFLDEFNFNKKTLHACENQQKTESAFYLSDLFLDSSNKTESNNNLKRILDLIFCNPFHTPTKQEFGMFVAKSASLRSYCISRQVGASIVNEHGDIISVGANKYPKSGGGTYCDIDSDKTKHSLDTEFITCKYSETIFEEQINEFLEYLKCKGWTFSNPRWKSSKILEKKLSCDLKNTKLVKANPFRNRNVHAEMSAITDAARRGVSIQNSTMYSTTFPCHDCAKHILTAGITKVIYIEPYPKSNASRMWPSEIVSTEDEVFNDHKYNKGKVIFKFFTGISPSRYLSLFAPVVPRHSLGPTGEKIIKRWKPENSRFEIKNWSSIKTYKLHSQIEESVLSSVCEKFIHILHKNRRVVG